MKYFTIPSWDKNTDIVHYATTWKLYKDTNKTELVAESLESSENLISWKVNLPINNNNIYYITALRHFKDPNGDIVPYDDWLPLLPVTTNGSNNETILSRTDMENPVITNVKVTNSKLNISVEEYKGIGIAKYLNVVITNLKNNILLNKRLDVTDNNSYEVILDTFDITNYKDLTLMIFYTNNLGMDSYYTTEIINYGRTLIDIKGNLNNINPTIENKIEVISKGETNVTVTSAVISKLNGLVDSTVHVENNVITLPVSETLDSNGYLEPNGTYILKVNYEYINNDGKVINNSDEFRLSTIDDNFSKIYNFSNVEYENKITDYNTNIDVTNQFFTEQSYLNVIPFIIDNKIVFKRAHDKEFIDLAITNIDITTDLYKFIFVDVNKLLLFYNKSNKVNINYYKISDDYTNLTLINTLTTKLKVDAIKYNNIHLGYGNNINIFTVKSNKVVYNKYDIINNEIKEIASRKLPDINSLKTIASSPIDETNFIIYPKTQNGIYTYKYNTTYNKAETFISIPTDYRNLDLYCIRLVNGNVLFMKNVNEVNHDFLIYDRSDTTITTITNLKSYNIPYDKVIDYKSSSIGFLYKDNESKIAIFN